MVISAPIRRGPARRAFSSHIKGNFWGHEPSEMFPVWVAPQDTHPEFVHFVGDVEIRPLGGGWIGSSDDLQQRLNNANRYFERKAAEVLDDDRAVRLLAVLYQRVVIDISEIDSPELGLALAKLTAANFCEIGTDTAFITKSGQKFINSIIEA